MSNLFFYHLIQKLIQQLYEEDKIDFHYFASILLIKGVNKSKFWQYFEIYRINFWVYRTISKKTWISQASKDFYRITAQFLFNCLSSPTTPHKSIHFFAPDNFDCIAKGHGDRLLQSHITLLLKAKQVLMMSKFQQNYANHSRHGGRFW